jgi:hypothetical protein
MGQAFKCDRCGKIFEQAEDKNQQPQGIVFDHLGKGARCKRKGDSYVFVPDWGSNSYAPADPLDMCWGCYVDLLGWWKDGDDAIARARLEGAVIGIMSCFEMVLPEEKEPSPLAKEWLEKVHRNLAEHYAKEALGKWGAKP